MHKNKQAAIPVLFLTIFIDLLGFGIVFPLLPGYAKELKIPDASIGILMGSFAFVQFFAAPFWGALSDRIGRRPVILISTIISMIAYFVFGFATSFAIILISRILSGFGSGNISAAQAYVADITPPQDRAKKMGIIGAAFGLGFAFGPALGGIIKTNFGIEYVGFVASGLCLLNFVLAYFILPESYVNRDPNLKRNYNPFPPIIKAFKIYGIMLVMVINIVYMISSFMFNVSANMKWNDVNNFDPQQIGLVFSFIGICTAITQGLLIGWFVKKFSEIRLMFMSIIILSICMIAITLVPSEWFIPYELMVLALLALGNGMLRPTAMAILSRFTDRTLQGTIMGVFASLSSLSMGIGASIATIFYALNWHLPFYVGAGFLIIPILLIFALQAVIDKSNSSAESDNSAKDDDLKPWPPVKTDGSNVTDPGT
jgi:DHA1 family tetracycline resistance protein-like MFS transporter